MEQHPMGPDLQTVNREACELGPPQFPAVPSRSIVVSRSLAQHRCAWSFMFVLKVFTWHLATPWGPGEPAGGSVKVLTAGLRAWRPLWKSGGKPSLNTSSYPCIDV